MNASLMSVYFFRGRVVKGSKIQTRIGKGEGENPNKKELPRVGRNLGFRGEVG